MTIDDVMDLVGADPVDFDEIQEGDLILIRLRYCEALVSLRVGWRATMYLSSGDPTYLEDDEYYDPNTCEDLQYSASDGEFFLVHRPPLGDKD